MINCHISISTEVLSGRLRLFGNVYGQFLTLLTDLVCIDMK